MSQSLPEMVLQGRRRVTSGSQPEQRLQRTRRETAKALSVVPLFAGLTKGDLNRLAEETDVVSFPAGSTIVEEGLLGETMFVVLTGEAKVLQGKLLDGAPRSASVVAETPLEAIRLYRRTLLKMLEAEPQMALKILDSLVRRVRNLTRSLDA